MEPRSTTDVNHLLDGAAGGDARSADALLRVLYDDLRLVAERQLRRERPDHTLQPTALVHEAYLRLVDQRAVDTRNRAHFMGLAARMFRRILVDHARARGAAKRGGDRGRVTLAGFGHTRRSEVDLVELDDALARLAEISPVQARIVELRFFGGLEVEEAATLAGVSRRSAFRAWSAARAWLYRELGDAEDDGTGDGDGD